MQTIKIENGNCPFCQFVEGHNEKMMLNVADYWECPDCHLQAMAMADAYVGILPVRGSGSFRKEQHDSAKWLNGQTMLRAPKYKDEPTEDCELHTVEDLNRYGYKIFLGIDK